MRWMPLVLLLGVVTAQDNAGSNVADGLLQCYNTTELMHREFRLPSTINILIDLIRQVEDGKSNQNAMSFAIELIHRFRQDGIVSTHSPNPYVFPYTPKGHQLFKNILLLKQFIPGTAMNFPNETLNAIEGCSLHYMLSNTIALEERGDEARVCNTLDRYTLRIKRELENFQNSNDTGKTPDVEVLLKPRRLPDNRDIKISDCPIEDGVVYTKWGSIQAGSVLAGIAAGFENIAIESEKVDAENEFAATISGDIAEVATWQGTNLNSYDVGTKGSWNSTLVPKYYFINDNEKYQFTDAEIRGDLDGLIMATKVQQWTNRFSQLKLSQILDMYYSPRGVYSENFKACERNKLSTEVFTKEKLIQQSEAFGYIYNNIGLFAGTIPKQEIPGFISRTVENYLNYLPKLNDLNCDANELQRVATDIIIVLDTQWRFNDIQPAISYLLENLDINKYESTYTLINGQDGEVLVNRSHSLLPFHELYNNTVNEKVNRGFSLQNSMPSVERVLREKLSEDKSKNNMGGKSSIVLFVPNSQTIPSDEGSYFQSRRSEILSNYLPDVKFIVLGPGNKDAYSSLVQSSNDAFTLAYDNDNRIIESVRPMIQKIAEIPRSVKNPRCGDQMTGDVGSNSIELAVEPGTINYYKIAPNYLVGEGPKNFKIRAQYEQITFCYSRSESMPSENTTGSCEKLSGNEKTIELTDTCLDTVGECSPLYFSVAAQITKTSPRCRDCRFPDNVKYILSIDGFSCTSSGNIITTSFALVALMLYFLNM